MGIENKIIKMMVEMRYTNILFLKYVILESQYIKLLRNVDKTKRMKLI